MNLSGNSRFREGNWLCKLPLVLAPLACTISMTVRASDFEIGEVSGRYNGSISAGGIWNASKPQASAISQGNANSIGYGSAGQFNPNGARTGDDSRLNFHKRGELVSSPVTALGEIEFKWQNYGALLRAKAWYDYTLNNKDVPFGNSTNGYDHDAPLSDSHFDDLAKFQGIALLDAYVFADYEIGSHPLNVRAGNQVVNWGEGLFFQNGINSINPIDSAALRRPGAQVKEGLLPVPMLYGNFGVTDSLSVESFYQLAWRKTVLEGCGTYFSTNDYAAPGCFGVPQRPSANDQISIETGQYIARAKDKDARDSGQFGLALKYFADSIGTEFGTYAMKIHSRTPYINTIADQRLSGAGWQNPTTQAIADANAKYYDAFPEDIRIFGLSFSTEAMGSTVFGEYSYRPNQPVQLNSSDTLQAYSGDPGAALNGTGGFGGVVVPLPLGPDGLAAAPGAEVNGYDRLKISQLSLGTTRTFSQVLGANSLSLTAEAAAKYIHDLPSLDERRYGRTDIYGTNMANGSAKGCQVGVPVEKYKKYACTSDGFVTAFSWGYRLRGQLNYPGAFLGVNVSPYVAFGQDIKGWSYDGNLVEDRLTGSVGIKADYRQTYSADLSWSGSGNTPYASTDKDFIALSVRAGF